MARLGGRIYDSDVVGGRGGGVERGGGGTGGAPRRHNRSGASGGPLEVRIGASAGDVAFEEGDCFGTPVIEAARVCAAAGGGQILVTEVVRVLAGTGGGHQVTPVGALDLKGLPAPGAARQGAR